MSLDEEIVVFQPQVWSVKPANPREVFGSPDLGTGVRTKGSSGGLASPQPRTWPKTPADK